MFSLVLLSRMTASGFAQSKSALLPRQSTWILIPVLLTCELNWCTHFVGSLMYILTNLVYSWVFTPNSGQKKGGLGTRAVYDPGNSSTSQMINGSSWSISYGTPHQYTLFSKVRSLTGIRRWQLRKRQRIHRHCWHRRSEHLQRYGRGCH